MLSLSVLFILPLTICLCFSELTMPWPLGPLGLGKYVLVGWMWLLCKAQADVQHSHQLFLKGASGVWQVELQIVFKECVLFWRTCRSSVKSVFMCSFSPTISFIVIPKFCRINNGDCEQFCSVRRDGRKDVLCSCADGYVLAEDGKHCVATGTKP